jgi:hypothetical protein
MCLEVIRLAMFLVTLERMLEGVVYVYSEGWILFHYTIHPLNSYSLTIGVGVCDGGMMKITRDLESDKVWQIEVLSVMWVWRKRVFVYLRSMNAPCAFVFCDVSYGTLVGDDGLHMISLWRKACLQYDFLPDLLFNYVLHLS